MRKPTEATIFGRDLFDPIFGMLEELRFSLVSLHFINFKIRK